MPHAAKAAIIRREHNGATATVFHVAFRALPKKTREEFLGLLLSDEDLRDNLEGALLWEQRKNEPRIPFEEVLKNTRARSR